ncbi:MAG: hypothetical protein LBU89_09750 [Fibromonadaceae bacterium]|nr:hypothetical protein [Fibromonadaceae bacterium]
MFRFSVFYFSVLILFLTGFVYSGEPTKYWNVEKGASTMKIFSMPTEPRQAALAGAGIASPRNAGEAMRNPLAGTAMNSPTLSFSRTELSNLVGANRISMLAGSLFGDWHLTAGIESLNYEKIQGYTDDGLTADGLFFTAGTMAMQLGAARTFNSMSAGLTARYANQNIDDYNMSGILFDGGVKYNLQKHLAFGATFNNLGLIFSNAKEVAPLFVQAGVTTNCPLPLGFSGALSTDLYKRNDSAEELRTGLEIMYKELFSLRFGYPFSKEENSTLNAALSAGLAIKLDFVSIEYAYQNRSALKANHIIGVNLYF